MKTLLVIVTMCCCFSLKGQLHVQNFTLVNSSDGGSVSLDSYKGNAVAIVFTSNACPFDTYYTERLNNLINSYLGKVPFILINSYQEPEESIEKMKVAIDRWNFHAPYLADKDQAVMEKLSAKRSPEAFLLSGGPGKYQVVYHGAIDDNPQSAGAVTKNYLKVAIDQLLAKQTIEPAMTRTVGCTIRKK